MNKNNRKEIKLALAVISAIVIVFVGINYLKGINLFKNYSVSYVNFEDVTGLEESNAVYVNGCPVGIVRTISYDYDNPGHIRVAVQVEEGMKFPVGSHAELKSAMLGGTTMSIILGKSNTYLQPGDEFNGCPERGIMDAVKELSPSIGSLLHKLDLAVGRLDTLLAHPALIGTLENMASVSGNLVITTSRVNRLLGNDIPSLLAKLDKVGDNTIQLTDRLKEVDYARTIALAQETLTEVKQLTSDLDKKINSKEGSLGLLLNDNQLYVNLNSTLQSSDALLKDLKEHPKRYVHFSLFGRKDK